MVTINSHFFEKDQNDTENYQSFLNNLEYGKLYVFTCNEMRGDAYAKMLKSTAVVQGEWMQQLEIEKVVLPEHFRIDRMGLVVAARRFDTASLGRYAVIACVIPHLGYLDRGMQMFASKLFNMDADDKDTFLIITPEQFLDEELNQSEILLEKMQPKAKEHDDVKFTIKKEEPRKPSLFRRIRERIHPAKEAEQEETSKEGDEKQKQKPDKGVTIFTIDDSEVSFLADEEFDNSYPPVDYACPSMPCPASAPCNYPIAPEAEDMPRRDFGEVEILKENIQENQNIEQLERERQNDLELIKGLIVAYIAKYHADPKEMFVEQAKGKYVISDTPSVVVNGELKVVLPELDETELKMEAASRTLYIWFLLHPEGCTRRDLPKHRQELIEIYSMVKPGSNYPEDCVDAVLEPHTLTTNISRIKRTVSLKFLRKEDAERYYIKANSDGVYKIDIASDVSHVKMPRALTM